MTHLLLCFDVEDSYFPDSARVHDIDRWMAEILAQAGLQGTFFLHADVAAYYQREGRRDVIEALGHHALGSHQHGLPHPFVPEVVEEADWPTGVALCRALEAADCGQIAAVMGRAPQALSMHHCFSAAQHLRLAAELGVPYLYGHPHVLGHEGLCWFAGALNAPFLAAMPWAPEHTPGHSAPLSYFDFGERSLGEPAAVEAQLARFDARLELIRDRGLDYLTVFMAHPCHVRVAPFSSNYTSRNGIDWPDHVHPGFGRPNLRDTTDEAAWQAGFRRIVQRLAADDTLRVITPTELTALYGPQPEWLPREVLRDYAQRVVAAASPLAGPECSAAEGLTALAAAVAAGAVAARAARRDVLGPTSEPVRGPEIEALEPAQLQALCSALLAEVELTGHLPADVRLEWRRIGIGTLLAAVAQGYLALDAGQPLARLVLPVRFPRHPPEAEWIESFVRCDLKRSMQLNPELRTEAICNHYRWQSWTLKPARLG